MEQEEGQRPDGKLPSEEPVAKRQRLEEVTYVEEATSIEYQITRTETHVNQEAVYAAYEFGVVASEPEPEQTPYTSEEAVAHEETSEVLLPALPPAHPWHIGAQESYFRQLYVADEFEHHRNNFLKLALWSADGTCMLTTSEDNLVRIFEVPADAAEQAYKLQEMTEEEQLSFVPHPLRSVLQIKEGETVYDACWYPHMNSQQPSTCCFLTTSRDHPIHMWDAFTGQHRATYRAYDHMDEITAALSITFNLTADKIYAGYSGMIRIFDTASPGRSYRTLSTKDIGAKGIVSCLAFNPDYSGLVAAGSYSGLVGLYTEGDRGVVSVLEGHRGGVTQALFTPDGNYLFTGARKENDILCWDIRNTSRVVMRLSRLVDTNQHIRFDIDPTGKYLITASQDSRAYVYDLQTGGVVQELLGHTDVVNSAAFHPFAPLVATATGDRKYAVQMKNFDDDASDEPKEGEEARATGAAGDQTAATEKGKEKEEEEEEEPEEAEEESEQQRRPHQQNVLALWSQLARRQTPGEL